MPDARVFVRGAATAMPCQRLYEIGGHDIDLSLNDGRLLQGQVLALGDEDVSFERAYCMLYGGDKVRCGSLSAGGEFELPDVSSGPFDLVIESRTLRLVLRGICFHENREGR